MSELRKYKVKTLGPHQSAIHQLFDKDKLIMEFSGLGIERYRMLQQMISFANATADHLLTMQESYHDGVLDERKRNIKILCELLNVTTGSDVKKLLEEGITPCEKP